MTLNVVVLTICIAAASTAALPELTCTFVPVTVPLASTAKSTVTHTALETPELAGNG
jgi:hypothetical protein